MKKTLYLLVIFAIMALPANAANLVVNGDFEAPEVESSAKWEVFPSGTEGLGWTVEWVGTYSGAPAIANLELHEGVLMSAHDGDQSAELDTDWTSANGEQASVKIYQDITTCVGGEYTLSYAWSPRPNHSDNEMEVYWGGILKRTHSGSTSGWQVETITGLTVSGATTRLEFVETGTADSLGMFLDAVSVEQTKDCVVRSAEITSPEAGDTVSGEVEFGAFLVDDDEDGVQWAVRQGTCAAGQGTVFGNVDGFNDDYDWDYDAETYTHTFLATADTCEWEPGEYCFVFNPIEDSGEANIRLTREFVVASCDTDEDDDGIDDEGDMCGETEPDTMVLKPNHFGWFEGLNFSVGAIPANEKGKAKGPGFSVTMEATHGCSCFQILEWLHDNYPEEYGEMKGHYKHGCSKSIIEDFLELAQEEPVPL